MKSKILFIYLRSYVDAYRMVAVQVGGSSDLKNIIQQSGMKLNMTDMNPGEPNDETFVKQVKFVLLDSNTTLSYFINQ